MPIRAAGLFAFPLLTIAFCGNASAQLTITVPEPTEGQVRQVSLSSTNGILAARRDTSNGSLIRVAVQYMMVDDATREAIYETLEPTAIKRSTHVPEIQESGNLVGINSPIASSNQVKLPSRVTTCVLNDSDTALVLRKAFESSTSDVSKAPSVTLLEGNEAEMRDIVQRPFVVDMQQVGDVMKPIVQVVDDGALLRLMVNLGDSPTAAEPSINLTCEITVSQILDVRTDQIFGLGDEPVTVQTPIHQITTATISQPLAKGQTMFVDPGVTKLKRVQTESAVPMLGKIPYVGKTFKNIVVDTVELHMLVLLQPSIETVNP